MPKAAWATNERPLAGVAMPSRQPYPPPTRAGPGRALSERAAAGFRTPCASPFNSVFRRHHGSTEAGALFRAPPDTVLTPPAVFFSTGRHNAGPGHVNAVATAVGSGPSQRIETGLPAGTSTPQALPRVPALRPPTGADNDATRSQQGHRKEVRWRAPISRPFHPGNSFYLCRLQPPQLAISQYTDI